jgi:hypothetical protein
LLLRRLVAFTVAALGVVWSHVVPAALPVGHPSVDGASQRSTAAPKDLSLVDPTLAPGTIRVEVLGQAASPVAGAAVSLRAFARSSAKAIPLPDRSARTDKTAVVFFDGLATGDSTSYEVSVSSPAAGTGTATYRSGPFTLDAQHGQHVRLYLFPVTSRIEDALIGMQGLFYLELEDDALGVNAIFEVYNIGLVTWQPLDVVLDLPQGYSSFQSDAGPARGGFEELAGRGAELRGSFAPGQQDARFRFRLPYPANGSLNFSMTLPPHIGRLRVMSETAEGLALGVDGLPEPVIDVDDSGRRVLSTERELAKGDPPLTRLAISLDHIPGLSRSAPWSFAMTFAVMLGGLFLAYSLRHSRLARGDLLQARSRLVDEVAVLDEARRRGIIGAEGYDLLRQVLLDALGRILTHIEQ